MLFERKRGHKSKENVSRAIQSLFAAFASAADVAAKGAVGAAAKGVVVRTAAAATATEGGVGGGVGLLLHFRRRLRVFLACCCCCRCRCRCVGGGLKVIPLQFNVDVFRLRLWPKGVHLDQEEK